MPRLLTLVLVVVVLVGALGSAGADPAPRRPINWWRVAGWSAVGVGGGFVGVGLGHSIGARLDTGDLQKRDAAGQLPMAARLSEEARIRSIQNGALTNYGIGAAVALVGMVILLVKPARPAVASGASQAALGEPSGQPTITGGPTPLGLGTSIRF